MLMDQNLAQINDSIYKQKGPICVLQNGHFVTIISLLENSSCQKETLSLINDKYVI